ncbi:FAD-dependent monooxygenase [Maritalea porphyrae]|uniref:FAD-dependent monooxygenase n=1 Tax=Maritalea porphyrae TaxID=880732 RepID=UPI0022B037A8|nr:FAD-dependent monooxygenase [Maritalea porphyrae]MCZ4272275.1 FAD-dependent monooxygenase [Maritalea porphyrae]
MDSGDLRSKKLAKNLQFDVLIVGAGPVGLTLALALKQFAPGMRVAINDVRPLEVPRDERSSALALGVTSVFEALGVWDQMIDEAEPIKGMKITDSDQADIHRPLFLQFEGDVKPGKPFAHMVPNRVTLKVLIEAAKESGVEVFAPNKAARFEFKTSGVDVVLEDGTGLSAALMVGADGARSALREMAKIDTFGHDYKQSGIVTTFAHEFDHDQIAYEHFLPAGPFATLPLPNKRSSLVWTERTQDVQQYLDMDLAKVALEIEKRMGSSFGKVTVEAPLQAFPLRLQIAKSFIGDRLALIGDAAHVVHPIAGQGMNLGIKDVAALAEVVILAMRHGEDIGHEAVLERYEKWRRMDIGLMAVATDGLNKLFSNNLPPLRVIRDVGLGVVDRLPILKNAFIGHAAAAQSNGPRLLSGRPI